MKVSILVILVVLPMVASISLYCYALISTRWSFIDNDLIKNKQRENLQLNNNNIIQLEKEIIRHGFRSRYGLFGYCLDYKWLNLFTIKSQNNSQEKFKSNTTLSSQQCDQKLLVTCQERNLCVKRCNPIPECPSYIDQEVCIRNYQQTRYYWKEEKCMWNSLSLDIQGIPRWLSSYLTSSRDTYDMKRIRYYIMFLLFLAAPLLTILGLLILLCINCVDRFYSIPFIFVSCFSLAAFLSGISGLGIFLYEWIHERLYQFDYTTEFNQIELSIVALNPWIINVERLGLAFWIIILAIGINLFTTILSCCFCCGLQSEKSKLRIYVNNDKYTIIHTSLYDE